MDYSILDRRIGHIMILKKLYKLVIPNFFHDSLIGPFYRGLVVFYKISIKKISFHPSFDFYYYLGKKIGNNHVIFYDVGANKGQSIRKAMKHFRSLSKIVAMEPLRNDELTRIVEMNQDKIIPYYSAIGLEQKNSF
jgi:hypothetical protein